MASTNEDAQPGSVVGRNGDEKEASDASIVWPLAANAAAEDAVVVSKLGHQVRQVEKRRCLKSG